MRAGVLLGLILLVGCHLVYGHAPPGDGRAPDLASSAGDSRLELAPADASPRDRDEREIGTAAASCPGDPTLVACYRFEQDAVEKDDSPIQNDLTSSSVSSVAGVVGHAVEMKPESRLKAPHHASLIPPALTFEVWFRAGTLPGSGRAGIVDKQGAYGIFIYPPDQLVCKLVDGTTAVPIKANAWYHVACTYDGVTVQLYLDGKPVETVSYTEQLGQGTDPLVVGGDSPSEGDRFEGLLDNLRIWKTVRTESELCAAAKMGLKVCP